MTERQQTEHVSFDSPDETRTFDHGRVDLLKVGGAEIGRLVLSPGWRWSNDVKALAGTDLCEAPHFQYHIAGTLHVQMADGSEFEARPATSPPCRRATTPGWSATSMSSWSTGSARVEYAK